MHRCEKEDQAEALETSDTQSCEKIEEPTEDEEGCLMKKNNQTYVSSQKFKEKDISRRIRLLD